jgi:hypothetical protein
MTDADTLDSPCHVEEAPPGFRWVRLLAQLLFHETALREWQQASQTILQPISRRALRRRSWA